jgi:hypothetical protein
MRSWLQLLLTLTWASFRPSPETAAAAPAAAPVAAAAPPAPNAVAYPIEMQQLEASLLRRRNSRLSGVGIAVSGGGIRSATFALGVFQGLARLKRLRHIDYLSTVSGGGYFGSFLGRLFTRPYVQAAEDVEWILNPGEPGPPPRRELKEARQNILRWLRENGRYLAPAGSGDLLLAAASLLRNWAALQGVITTALFSLFLLLQVPRVIAASPAVSSNALFATLQEWNRLLIERLPHGLWWSPWTFVPLVLGAIAFAVGWAYWIVTERSTPARTIVWVVALAIEAVILWAGSLIPALRIDPVLDQRPAFMLLWLPALAAATYFRPVDGAPASIGLSLLVLRSDPNGIDRSVAWLLLVLASLSIAFGGGVWLSTRSSQPESGQDRWLFRGQLARNLLTRYLRAWLVAVGVAAAVVLVDSLGQTIYALTANGHLKTWAAAIVASVTGAAGFGRRLVLLIHPQQTQRPSLPASLTATVMALALIGIIAVGFNLLSHSVAWQFGPAVEETVQIEAPSITHPHEDVGPRQPQRQALRTYALWVGGTLLLTLAFGRYFDFLNFSSQQTLYSSRLIRAYLGASNPSRWAKGNYYPVTEPLPDDDIEVHRYWEVPAADVAADTAYDRGAPLHLVNVTVNETFSGQSQVQQQDRKGVGMALGPAGVSAGVRHHIVYAADERPSSEDVETAKRGARFKSALRGGADHIRRLHAVYPKDSPQAPAFRVFDYAAGTPGASAGGASEEAALASAIEFPGEPLSLGRWVGISGAAFSTGIGYRTSLGMSVLTGLSNIRLGYWWNSGISSKVRGAHLTRRTSATDFLSRMVLAAFPVHTYLFYELGAHFPGTSRRFWYLSDGGHFENMGGYELVRRELPLIIVIDSEADPTYTYEGLANLVRKARVDFNASITFETNFTPLATLAADGFGTLETLRPLPVANDRSIEPHRAGAHAALGRIEYGSGRTGTLIYIKPGLTGDEPMDVLEYSRHHPPFPQQPTSDQFFDEAQWESYRALGEHVARQVFADPDRFDPAWWERQVWSAAKKM